jgi:hypothetical protein
MKTKKFRCSSFGRLMTGAVLPTASRLTEAQQKELSTLLEKIKLTDIQAKKRDELISKRDTPVVPKLSEGAKTYIEEEFLKDRFDYGFRFTNRFVEKGKEVEERSIRQVGAFLGYPFATKAPEKYLENDFICSSGYDWKVKKFVFDQKNVWSPSGLKLFENDKDIAVYEWQVRGYAMLINELENGSIEAGAVIRTLMNPSAELIFKQARLLWVEAGNNYNDEIPESFLLEVEKEFDFEGKFPNISDRMKIHRVECTQEHFDLIKVYVKLAQDYYNSLESICSNVNDNAINFFRNEN